MHALIMRSPDGMEQQLLLVSGVAALPGCEIIKKRRTVIGDLQGLTAKKMFGGVGYIVNGNMACGVNEDSLIVRVDPERYVWALSEPFTSEFDMTHGKTPTKGWVSVSPEELSRWVGLGVSFTRTLPPKRVG